VDTTVLITGLSTSGATKQRLVFRLAGSFIGGLILALGATVFLFPYMDSITSLVLLTAAVALLSAWVAGGRNFSYVGLQIAFSYYLVVFAGFSAPTELAPARDRLIATFELQYLTQLVTQARGNMSRAARAAGVDRTTLYRLMERHGLHRKLTPSDE